MDLGELLQVGAQDRVLVIAPHPDDESIATGGLLQTVRAAGAALRLVVLTDGDNNPWPQRWIEKRWHVGAAERARWGARRREEAHAALRVLGVDADDACFLGLPDLGLTDLLMRADAATLAALVAQLDEFAPSLLVFPAASDRHPDHNAAHVLLRCALARSTAAPRLLTFAVHGASPAPGDVAVDLDARQREIKRDAILAHATQMQFSRRRFLAFASERENYQPAEAIARVDAAHPVQARICGGRVDMRVDLHRLGAAALHSNVLFLVLEYAGGSVRCVLSAARNEQVSVLDCVAAAPREPARLRRRGQALEISVEPAGIGSVRLAYVKFARREPGWRVFDRFGWQAVAT